jgi:hypothetical protein
MADNPNATKPAVQVGQGLPAGGVDAPFIYFDVEAGFHNVDGVVAITLAAVRTVPTGGANLRNELVVTGYLRCSETAARGLRHALDQALLLGAKTEGEAEAARDPLGPRSERC